MDLMMDKTEFSGFTPDRTFAGAITRTFDAILGSAPSDSEPLARFQRTAEGFKGFLRLSSKQGIFIVEAVGREPLEMISRLRDRMNEQLGAWRGRRSITA